MEDSGSRRTEIEIPGFSLIDVSSEDDSLLFSSFLDPSSNDFSETDNGGKVLRFLSYANGYGEETQVLQPHESPESDKLMTSGKYNLRKSLAWDNAFFTSAGVLEPEELSSMMGSNHKGERQSLSTIQEDHLQRSAESISTFQSDCTVENSQEIVFFEDIRASIQRSAKASAASMPDKSKETVAIEAATGPTSSMAKDPLSQENMKPKASPKKQSSRAQGLVKATTKQPGLNASVPKVFGKVMPMPSASMKRASLDVNKTKHEKDSKLAGGKHHPGSRPVLPRPVVVPSKSCSRSSVASANELTSSCSSLESCATASSSSPNLMLKKSDSTSLANTTIPKALDSSKDESFIRYGSKVDELVHEGTERVSEANGGLVHHPVKLSGLRAPSPKIGFFDGMRSVARTSTGNIQPRSNMLSSLSKHGVNTPNGSAAKPKYEKLQPARARSPLQEPSNPKSKASGVSRSLRVVVSVSVSAPKAQKKMFSKISAEDRLKGETGNELRKQGEISDKTYKTRQRHGARSGQEMSLPEHI